MNIKKLILKLILKIQQNMLNKTAKLFRFNIKQNISIIE